MSDVFEIKFDQHKARGMFSVVNEVVDHLCEVKDTNYKLKFNWIKCTYEEHDTDINKFIYYFEDFFKIDARDTILNLAKRPRPHRSGYITPWDTNGLAQPTNRDYVSEVIKKYVKIKPHIQQNVDTFANENFNGYTIGLHIRGKGRVDGGAGKLRNRGVLVDGVPYNLYFDHLNEVLQHNPNAKILLCSDSQDVVDYCKNVYEDKIFVYPSIRSSDGETHRLHNFSQHKRRLGDDILTEASLLSRTDYLIHGSSNVTNYVLCKNSELKNFYIYGDDIK